MLMFGRERIAAQLTAFNLSTRTSEAAKSCERFAVVITVGCGELLFSA
jgi:hypothetical protein